MTRMYQATDKFTKKLKKRIRREFNYLSVLSFDELNPVRVRNETTEMYERFKEFNFLEYRAIVESARKYALSFLSEEEREKVKRLKGKQWGDSMIEYLFVRYNWVTGYLYLSEADRKRLRLAEEILTSKQYLDRERYNAALKKSANLWYTQSMQYAIDLEDVTCSTMWKEAGVKTVKWNAEDDEKTCSKCRNLDGRIFPIDDVPHKQHYNCRCFITPEAKKKDI